MEPNGKKEMPYLYKKLLALIAVKHQSLDGEFMVNQSISDIARDFRLSKSDMKILFRELEAMGLFERYKNNTGKGKITPESLKESYLQLSKDD